MSDCTHYETEQPTDEASEALKPTHEDSDDFDVDDDDDDNEEEDEEENVLRADQISSLIEKYSHPAATTPTSSMSLCCPKKFAPFAQLLLLLLV